MTLEKGRFAKHILIAIIIFLMLSLLYILRVVFIPILLSFFVAYLLNPLVELLERKKVHRTTAAVFILAILLIASFFLLSSLLSVIQREITIAGEKLPSYIASLGNTMLPKLKNMFMLKDMPTTIGEFLNSIGNYMKGLSPDVVSMLLAWLSSAFKSTISYVIALLGFLIMPFYIFYMLRDFEKLKTIVWYYIPPKQRNWFDIKWDEIDYVLSAFLRGQLILCIIMAILYSISLYVIGVELSFLIGVIAGAAFLVPFMGLVVGIFLSATMALLQFQDFWHPLYVITAFAAVQILEAYWITPKLIGSRIGLHPVITVVSILVWGELLGLFGVLIAVPLTAVLKVFLKSIADAYRSSPIFGS
ncbi:MAG: AI-2E family transporter [Deltaproteobacteria bacterium]|nr:AI-2E family transporter [Deltaproteobacteria bacterium]